MQSEISLKWPLFIISILGIALFFVISFFLIFDLPAYGSYVKQASSVNNQASQNLADNKNIVFEEQATSSLPVRLKIPKIKIDTIIEKIGLTPKGEVGVPKNPANAAWFNSGPRPGEIGNAIITGHYGRWKNGKGSVFDNLNKLKKGDKIYIKDEKGTTITFVVRESKKYNPNDSASEVFESNDGKAHLNLITCAGVWNKVSKSYPKRLVIFTDKEEPTKK